MVSMLNCTVTNDIVRDLLDRANVTGTGMLPSDPSHQAQRPASHAGGEWTQPSRDGLGIKSPKPLGPSSFRRSNAHRLRLRGLRRGDRCWRSSPRNSASY
jgi:hypothetical protein